LLTITRYLILIVIIFAYSSTLKSKAYADAPIYIYAAASTRNAVDETIKQFSRDKTTKISAVYGATSALARQILDGAPAALFLSANKGWMDIIIKANLVAEYKSTFSNRLVVISPKNNSRLIKIRSAQDIVTTLGKDRLSVAEISAVPAGIYSKQSMKALKIWSVINNKLAQSANVRAALALVERGETPLGLVYQTDARASPYVNVEWKIPENTHEKIQYPLAIIKTSANLSETKRLFTFFSSSVGQKIFSEFGFEVD
jgi:molybdate transport system substrate-binding protein